MSLTTVQAVTATMGSTTIALSIQQNPADSLLLGSSAQLLARFLARTADDYRVPDETVLLFKIATLCLRFQLGDELSDRHVCLEQTPKLESIHDLLDFGSK